ncbi:vitamin K epoxide reductase family protein [Spirosoma arcticum]
MTLSADEKNAFFVLKTIFNLKKVRVTSTTLKNQLLQEPTFPGLMALSNVLTDFNVHNVPVVIKPEQLCKIPLPAIAHFTNGMGYCTITKVEKNQVEYHHSHLGTLRESISEFAQKWQGLILIVKPNENLKETSFEDKLKLETVRKFRMPFVYASIIFLFGYFFLKGFNYIDLRYILNFYEISFIKVLGLISSVILIRSNIYADKSIIENTNTFDKLKNDFIKSLTLESRKIFGWLTWSELGLVYFVIGLSFLFLLDNVNKLVFIKWFNLATTFYILWAIYYQIVVIRKWCFICLATISLFCAEFFSLINIPLFIQKYDSFPANVFLINLLLITGSWVFIRQHLVNSFLSKGLYISLQRTKFSADFVQSLFNKEPTIPPFFEAMQTVMIGNPEAQHKLFAVLNPNSILCATKLDELISLITLNEKINCKVILVPDSPEDVLGIKTIKSILNYSNEQRLVALKECYKYTSFKKCNFSDDITANDKLAISVNENINWAFLARIPLTVPTIYLNNNVLSSIYGTKEVPMLFRILSNKY